MTKASKKAAHPSVKGGGDPSMSLPSTQKRRDRPLDTRREPGSVTARAKLSAPQCVAIKTNGERCKAAPIHGARVCRVHGGAAPQVKKRAAERLMAAADSLMAELLKIAHNPKEPVYVRLTAIRDALDRAGLGAKHATPLQAADDDPWAVMLGVALADDRDMSEFTAGQPAIDAARYNEQQLSLDAREESWRDLDREDDDADRDARLPYDPARPVVVREVVDRESTSLLSRPETPRSTEYDPTPRVDRGSGGNPWAAYEQRVLDSQPEYRPSTRYPVGRRLDEEGR